MAGENKKDGRLAPHRKNSGMWKPGESGNPNGRPKKRNALTDSLEKSAKTTFSYWEGGQQRRKTKADFITELVLGALTTGQFVFPPQEQGGETISIPVGSSDLMKLIQFYYSRLEGTPKRVEPEVEERAEDKQLTDAELEEIRTKRWESTHAQIAELLAGEDDDAGGPSTETQ